MNLPDLALQIVYGRLAWALVLAAMLLAVLPRMLAYLWPDALPVFRRRLKTVIVAVTLVLLALMALPGEASPAFWLALVFQYPSALLLGYSLMALGRRWQGRPVRYAMPTTVALVLVAAGLLLYLDTFGVLALGLYYVGFGAVGAPLLACAVALACGVAIVLRRGAGLGGALLIGVLAFSLLRLPTGNLWDALLDPMLWSWALASAVAAAARRYAAGKVGARVGAGAAVGAGAGVGMLEPLVDEDAEFAQVRASGIE